MITKPPVLFPLVALFHMALFTWTIISLIQQPGISTEMSALWMLGYTICWLATTDMRKWGAMLYVIVTVVSIILYFTVHDKFTWLNYASPIFILDMLFCFFIMFYFKRFR